MGAFPILVAAEHSLGAFPGLFLPGLTLHMQHCQVVHRDQGQNRPLPAVSYSLPYQTPRLTPLKP